VAGKKILDEVKIVLEDRFGIRVKRPIVLELVNEKKPWLYGIYWLAESLGKYKSHLMIDEKYHLIYVLRGLKKERFKAILSHELAHAYLYEAELFSNNRAFREGMARWIEYKILLQEGEKEEARKLLSIKSWLYGRGIAEILELEKKTGERELLPYLHSIKNNKQTCSR